MRPTAFSSLCPFQLHLIFESDRCITEGISGKDISIIHLFCKHQKLGTRINILPLFDDDKTMDKGKKKIVHMSISSPSPIASEKFKKQTYNLRINSPFHKASILIAA